MRLPARLRGTPRTQAAHRPTCLSTLGAAAFQGTRAYAERSGQIVERPAQPHCAVRRSNSVPASDIGFRLLQRPAPSPGVPRWNPGQAVISYVCSNSWMLTPNDFGLSDWHYRIQGQQLSEAMPNRCPSGHLLGKNTVLIGNHPCVNCTGSSHRTWRCRECDACWIWPACADRPEWPEWPGINAPQATGSDQPSDPKDS